MHSLISPQFLKLFSEKKCKKVTGFFCCMQFLSKKLKEDFCCEISLHGDMHLCTIKKKFQEKNGTEV